MCFDVPKEFGVPDEIGDMMRSQNGRHVKIDILDDYIQTSERFPVIQVFSGVPGSYGNSYWALMGHTEKEKEGRGRPPPPVQIGPAHGEGCGHPLRPFSPVQYGSLSLNTNARNCPVLQKISESLGTFPMSEYSRPIYRSLRLDHFETPLHVPDLIRDSELLRYIKTHKLII